MIPDPTPTPSLEGFLQHVELHGPDLVLVTARGCLSERDVGQLAAYLASKQRGYKWVGRWELRREAQPRACDFCGLSLPADAHPTRIRHDHCTSARKRQQRRPAGAS